MPDIQFIVGFVAGVIVALGAGSVLIGTGSPRVKRYVIIALIVAVACLLLNYAGCVITNPSGHTKAEKLSAPGRHFTDGCVLGAALAFILYMMRPPRR